MIVVPKPPADRWQFARRIPQLVTAAAATLTAIGGFFIAGYFATSPNATKLPMSIVDAMPLVSAAGAFWLFWLAAIFTFPGQPFMYITVPPGAIRLWGWERARVLLFGSFVVLTTAVLALVQIHYMITGRSISEYCLFLVMLAVAAGLPDSWKTYGPRLVWRRYLLPAVIASVYWLLFVYYAVVFSVAIGNAHHYSAKTDLWLVFYAVVFLVTGAAGALALSERRWSGVVLLPTMAAALILSQDAHDFFAAPIRMIFHIAS